VTLGGQFIHILFRTLTRLIGYGLEKPSINHDLRKFEDLFLGSLYISLDLLKLRNCTY